MTFKRKTFSLLNSANSTNTECKQNIAAYITVETLWHSYATQQITQCVEKKNDREQQPKERDAATLN
jgi:hypothetical protein